jgi:toxin-antitoxin system, antitoxin component, abrB famil
VRKQGNERIISPAGQSWDSFFAKPREQWLSDDFSVEQEPPQEREDW